MMFGEGCDGCKHLVKRNFGWRRWLRAIGVPLSQSAAENMAWQCQRIIGLWLRCQDERWPSKDTCGPMAKFREAA